MYPIKASPENNHQMNHHEDKIYAAINQPPSRLCRLSKSSLIKFSRTMMIKESPRTVSDFNTEEETLTRE
jgi:hypothetical protein